MTKAPLLVELLCSFSCLTFVIILTTQKHFQKQRQAAGKGGLWQSITRIKGDIRIKIWILDFLAWKTSFRVTYFLQIRVGWILLVVLGGLNRPNGINGQYSDFMVFFMQTDHNLDWFYCYWKMSQFVCSVPNNRVVSNKCDLVNMNWVFSLYEL